MINTSKVMKKKRGVLRTVNDALHDEDDDDELRRKAESPPGL